MEKEKFTNHTATSSVSKFIPKKKPFEFSWEGGMLAGIVIGIWIGLFGVYLYQLN